MDRHLRQFSIRQRLLGSMLLLSLIILGLGLWAAAALRGSQARAEQELSALSVRAETGLALQAALERVQRLEQMVLLTSGNTVEAGEHLAAWQKEIGQTRQLLAALPEAARRGPMAEGLAGFATYAQEVQPVLQQVVDAKLDGATGFAYTSRQGPELQKARAGFERWLAESRGEWTQAHAQAKVDEARQSQLRLVAVCALLLLFIGLMWQTAQSITRPVDLAIAAADRIASGDLSHAVAAQGRDEIARLCTALNRMQDALREVVDRVRHSADSIRTASDEVATGNLDLSQRTEQAASNLQQTAAAMEQLTGTVRHSADSAAQASQLAASASGVAQRGGDAVSQVVHTMEAIQQASRQIADITGVIDGIAFQTNILALNAAVEAARAGEQGRGFAVVAGEVRTLAQRSAEAAREIKGLIQASVDQVGSGTAQVAQAGATMNEILGSVRRVDDIIQEIASASGEQSKGIGEIGESVSALDQMTQQNAALVEQSAAAADSLRAQALNLTEVVATFRLSPHDGPQADVR